MMYYNVIYYDPIKVCTAVFLHNFLPDDSPEQKQHITLALGRANCISSADHTFTVRAPQTLETLAAEFQKHHLGHRRRSVSSQRNNIISYDIIVYYSIL